MNHTVSVIIPVLNNASLLQKVLQALHAQTYPLKLIEIIVIDNGSTDHTKEVAAAFGVTLLHETEIKSPYAARNNGLRIAKGAIIAMTDANKIPDPCWIAAGVEALIVNDADLVGGEILFDLDNTTSSAEIYDAITFNNNRIFVTEQNGAATGNLFFWKAITEKIGLFPGKIRTGMDIWWTQRAVENGFNLIFSEKSIVKCQPRKLRAVLKKSWRVGTMHPTLYRQNGKSILYILEYTFRTFAPPKIKPLRLKFLSLNLKTKTSLFDIWCIAWISKIIIGAGRVYGLRLLQKHSMKEFGA